VNIVVPGTTIGTSTDNKGHYSLSVPDNADSLTYSYIGYKTQRVAINGRTEIDISLQPTTISSGQVVVVGYGTQRKSDLTGSISTVKGSDVSRIPTTNVDNALQGQVAGVQVTPNSGQPGASATVRIRGVGTLNNASPIYVVDGMITDDISYLNPENVQSVEVLKDASATAIYGSRGANGVIIITTKKGTRNEKAQINFNAYYGWQSIENKISLTNASQYAMLVNELNANEGRPPAFQNPSSFGTGTDWQSAVYKTSPTENYDMSISGGTNNMTYSISGNYILQKGIIPGSQYKRMSLRVNNDYYLTKNLTVGHNIAYMHDYQQQEAPGVVGQAYQADPTKNPFNSSGDYNDITQNAPVGNPLATINYNHNRHYANRLVGNAYAKLDFLRNFELKTSFGLDSWQMNWKTFNPQYYVSPIQQAQHSNLNVNDQNSRNWLWENTLTYKADYKNNDLKLLAGVTAQGFKNELLGGSRQDIAGNGSNPALWYLSAGDQQTQTNTNTASDWNMLSYLFRANYTYMNRYLLTATYRIDGSSRFGKNNQYGYFPSVAAGWRISNEPFMKDIDFISNLKLRASWGKVGNDKISAYPGIPTVTSNLNAVFGPNETINYGATVISLANPDIKWEETTQTDIGLESGFLNDRISLEVDYYNRKTSGILVQAPIPEYVGASNIPYVNAAAVTNKGFDFNLKWNQTVSGFHYTIGLVASTVHNQVDKLGQGQDAIYGGGTGEGGKLATRTVVGEPIGAFYGYKVVGVFQNQADLNKYPQLGSEQPGDLRFADTNGDGVITSEDRTYLGSPIPSFIYGINLNANYKGFDLSISTSGQTGNKIYNAKETARFGTPNFETSYLNRWHGAGTSNTQPRITNGGVNYNVSSRFLENGSYFKIRNVQLGYNLPRRITNQVNVSSLKLYINAENLVTFTKYSGYTPEITSNNVLSNGIDHGVYPVARTISLGVNIKF
jgi:TonB-linked SusC/RagA family outer membrane protein